MSETLSGDLAGLTVRSIMSPDPVAVAPTAPLLEVVELMRRRSIGAVIVVEAGAPVGIFTERDLLLCGSRCMDDWNRLPIQELMTPAPMAVSPDAGWQSALDAMQQRNIRHAPVVEGRRLVGMLSMRDIMKHRVQLLESIVQLRTAELARQMELLAERDRERTHSLEIAGRIQRQLLPTVAPAFGPLHLAFAFHPHDQVAGDYFDFQVVGDTLMLIIGDASGHGVPAAFISVIAKTCIHTRLTSTASPAAVLAAMNEFLHGWVEPEHFISMFVAAIDRRTLRMTYARAGHPLPLLLRAEGAVTPLDAGGIMIGVLPHPDFPEQSVVLRPGDRVLFYTDGLTECPDARGTLFGAERVQEFLSRQRRLDGDELVARLVDEARGSSTSGEFADDLTVVLLEVQEPVSKPGGRGSRRAGST